MLVAWKEDFSGVRELPPILNPLPTKILGHMYFTSPSAQDQFWVAPREPQSLRPVSTQS